jgi:hypothetical protein
MTMISKSWDIHIFLSTFGFLVLVGRSVFDVGSGERYWENMGADVPPEGPLIRLLSVVILYEEFSNCRTAIVYSSLS